MIESYTSNETINRACENAARFISFDQESIEIADRAGREARRADAHRLVKASKSPTDRFPGSTGAYFNRPAPRRKPAAVELDQPAPDYPEHVDTPGTWAVVEHRDWSGEYRVRMETRPGQRAETPDQAGDRITAMLTERGARKISESCYFMACKRGGFSTFATLTLNEESRDKLRQKVLVPAGQMNHGWMLPSIEPARAKQGPFAPAFMQENQIKEDNEAATVAAEYAALHPDTFRPYTKLKTGWKWSVQREASRFFEAIGQMYKRGWQYRKAVRAGSDTTHPESGAVYCPVNGQYRTVKVQGSRALYCVEGEDQDKRTGAPFTRLKWWREPLSYLWVAENPHQEDDTGAPMADEHGELLTNPHIHLMMAWRVDYRHFPYWARRIEKLWGQGFAHLEKIKDPQKAGSYVAKAAGYLCKAQGKNDQGEIRGNRYGISKRARAPGWIENERYQVGMMGWLMAEAHELWNNHHGEKIQRREHLKYQLEAANDPGERRKIGRILEATRKEIEPLPRISKYAALFKSEEQKTRFFRWAENKGWTPEKQCSQWLHQWRRDQWKRRHRGRLSVGPEAIRAWYEMADSGAVACNDEERWEQIAI